MAERYKRIPSRMHTYSGKWIDPLDLKPSDVGIEDIAAHLSKQCRWTGAVRKFYSVAQHVVLASRMVPKEDAWDALHHDDPEWVLQDMIKPLKNDPRLGQAYRAYEKKAEKIIAEVFGVRFPLPPSVKEADVRMLVTEARDLMHGHQHWGYYEDVLPYDFTIKAWTPPRAEREFLLRYEQLSARRCNTDKEGMCLGAYGQGTTHEEHEAGYAGTPTLPKRSTLGRSSSTKGDR